jgi:xylulokinase
VVPEKFVTLAYFPSGIMVKWFHDLLYSDHGESPSDMSVADSEGEHYARLEAQSPDAPTGLCITPHLIGTCNPEFNPRARGIIAGLEAGTGRAHIYKGILEGLACELAILTDLLTEAAGEFDDIFVTGGGTRSTLGLRLRAALTGRRLHVMSPQESVCFGTAILGGIAIGEYASFIQAVNSLVSESTVVQPDKELAANYQDQLARYKRLRCTAVAQA